MLKKIALIMMITAGVLLSASCDVSISKSDPYNLVMTNGTGGILESVVVGSNTFTDVEPGDTCTAVFTASPVNQEITYTGKRVREFGAEFSKTVIVSPPCDGNNDCGYTLQLPSGFAAVWVENISETSTDVIDLLGIRSTSGAVTDVTDFESVSSYSGVEKEVLAENPSGTISGELANDNVSDIKLYVTVTGEQLTHDVAGESLAITSAWDDSQLVVTGETLATLAASTNGIIIKKSVEVYGSLGGGSETLVATDDGSDGLISGNGILSGTNNTIDYTSGVINLTCTQEFDTLTVTYKYITAQEYEIGSQSDSFVNVNPFPGSIVIKMGDEVIAREVYDNDDKKYRLTGDTVESSVSEYDYTGNKLHVIFNDTDMYSVDGMTGHLVIEYSYQIGDADGSGDITATGLTGTIDPASGDLSSVAFDTTAFEDVINGYDHTVTDLFTRYHIPYADYAGDSNIADASTPVAAVTAIDFTSATGVVDGFIGQQMIESGTVSMELGYSDGTTPTTVSITDDGSGNLLDGTTIVGTIDYTDGRIKLTVAPASGYEMTSAVVSGYSYYNVTSSNKAWVGFFDTSDLNGNYVYAMTGDASSVTGYRVVSYDWSSYTNSYGSTVLNLVFE